MNPKLFVHTILYLSPRQLIWQVIYRIKKTQYRHLDAKSNIPCFSLTEYVDKPYCKVGNFKFSFLNLEYSPSDWNDTSHGMLWAYNLNYMDYLLQVGMEFGEGLRFINKFIDELHSNRVGLDPYPIALRGINWIKWMALYGSKLNDEHAKKINDSLYSQYKLLERKLEYHLLGNHLLEDAYSLFIASIYFGDERQWRKASQLLHRQLVEQILPDGTHFEQSPMYHCILLERLLDCYNACINNERFGEQQGQMCDFVRSRAELMLGHLESIVWADGSIPMFNDSAIGIAPTPYELFDYAQRLGLNWRAIEMVESGYRRFSSSRIEAIVDIGGITASYQPGHTHADTFNYELRIDGRPFIVDTGISTYDKTPRRQYERGTSAHNTVTVKDCDSSEVWGGFRVGARANVTILEECSNSINASHDGYKPIITTRRFELFDDVFSVTDALSSPTCAKNFIHFAPGIKIEYYDKTKIVTDDAVINISGASDVKIADCSVSKEYNCLMQAKMAVIYFDSTCHYSITPLKK